jgi:hypothetical protein
MEKSRVKTAALSSQLGSLKGDLEGVFDVSHSLNRKFSELSLAFLQNLKAAGMEAGTLSEWIDSINVAGFGADFAKTMKTEFDKIKTMGIFDYLKDKMSALGAWLTKVIGDAITNGIKNVMPGGIGVGDLFKGLMGGDEKGGSKGGGGMMNWILDKVKVGGVDSKAIERNTSETNRILTDIATNGLGGTYA